MKHFTVLGRADLFYVEMRPLLFLQRLLLPVRETGMIHSGMAALTVDDCVMSIRFGSPHATSPP